MQNGTLGYPRNGNQEVLTLNRGPEIGFTLAARYGNTGLRIPVPTIRPILENSSGALDLSPKGPNPVEFPGNGFFWIDVCDADVQDANVVNGNLIPVHCARVAMTSTGAQFGCVPFNGATTLPVEILTDYNTVTARFTAGGFVSGSATHVPQARIEATDDTIVNFMNVFLGEGVAGTSSNHPYSIWTNNVKRAIFDTAGGLSGLSSITRTGGVSIEGTNTNNNAAAGRVGQEIVSQVLAGSAVGLVTGIPMNVTFIDLTAGDWDLSGQAYLNLAASTSWTAFQYSLTATSASADVTPGCWQNFQMPTGQVPGASNLSWGGLSRRVSIASTTRFYLMAQGTFTVSTASAWGVIRGRRVR